MRELKIDWQIMEVDEISGDGRYSNNKFVFTKASLIDEDIKSFFNYAPTSYSTEEEAIEALKKFGKDNSQQYAIISLIRIY